MRRLAMTVLLTFLLASGFTATLAQPPVPDPGVVGQRVEVPMWGFALTVPDDWTAIDTTRGDVDDLVVELEESHPGMASNIRGFAEAGYLRAFPLFASMAPMTI